LKYVALLRGINLGAKRRIAMADLRACLTNLGLQDVSTLLQSGNALFTSDDPAGQLAERIEAGLQQEFGMTIRCGLRSGPEIAAVVENDPLADVAINGSRYMTIFLSAAPDPEALAEHDPVALDPENIRLGDRVIYQWCPNGLMEAPAVGAFVDKHLGVWTTVRNWNTTTKLAAKLAD
jgi:uncharacterized protein (DUF1697 family)